MDFKKKAAACFRQEENSEFNDDAYISVHAELYVERALKSAHRAGFNRGQKEARALAKELIMRLKRGNCFCELGIGRPMQGHTDACEKVRGWLNG